MFVMCQGSIFIAPTDAAGSTDLMFAPHRCRSWVRRALHVVVRLLLAPYVASCDVNPFDAAQVPRVTVSSGAAAAKVVIAWQPAGARLVRVYRGASAGDGYSEALVWSIASTGSNTLASGIEYGTASPVGGTTDVPARPLSAGQSYTVEVTRDDPKGRGDGFTNTHNRYVGTATFAFPPNPSAP